MTHERIAALVSLCVLASESRVVGAALAKESVKGDCLFQARFSHRPTTNIAEASNPSSFHEVVGEDGALMLALDSLPGRSALASRELAKVGINVTFFSATNGNDTSPEILSKACIGIHSDNETCAGWRPSASKFGAGCKNRMVQAIAHSHQLALEHALTRNREWTAIFEDDAVPVLPSGLDWESEFRSAWKRLPTAAKVVRLGWCQFRGQAERFPEPNSTADGQFHFVQFPTGSEQFPTGSEEGEEGSAVGGCTTGYMVHQSVIPSMLSVFPCCIGVDACMALDFYAKQDPAILTSLMVAGGDGYIAEHDGDVPALKFRGVVMQATAQLGHTHDSWTLE